MRSDSPDADPVAANPKVERFVAIMQQLTPPEWEQIGKRLMRHRSPWQQVRQWATSLGIGAAERERPALAKKVDPLFDDAGAIRSLNFAVLRLPAIPDGRPEFTVAYHAAFQVVAALSVPGVLTDEELKALTEPFSAHVHGERWE